MRGEVTFTMKEVTRYSVIQSLLERKMVNREAARAIGLSLRQVQRIKRKVESLGPEGILHGNKGRLPSHAFSSEERHQVITMAEERYFDFNFSPLAEILEEEEGIRINRETLRLWLRPRGFGGKARKMPKHRKRRKRSAREGEKLFLDGSPHPWFGQEESTLILCTDDATGNPLYGLFQKEEDLVGCLRVCLKVFRRYGLPTQFYLDRASQFTTTRHGGLHVSQNDQNPTHFERAMRELGIGLVFAHSPQARGRAERINGTFQDRLVAELRLKGIHNAQDAMQYLNHHFIPRYRPDVSGSDPPGQDTCMENSPSK
ncbi:MAG: ISNCY family transposase [Pseudomonadota bacterium]